MIVSAGDVRVIVTYQLLCDGSILHSPYVAWSGSISFALCSIEHAFNVSIVAVPIAIWHSAVERGVCATFTIFARWSSFESNGERIDDVDRTGTGRRGTEDRDNSD